MIEFMHSLGIMGGPEKWFLAGPLRSLEWVIQKQPDGAWMVRPYGANRMPPVVTDLDLEAAKATVILLLASGVTW